MGFLDRVLGKKPTESIPRAAAQSQVKANQETTGMHYYLGVKSLQDAADAIDKLSFMKVLDKSRLQVQIENDDRITMIVGPASKDKDFSKGYMIYIGGRFTSDEMNEIGSLSRFADKSVTHLVTEFVARQVVSMQGSSVPHYIL